ncbi:hypothetical protein PT974_07294 [Cladobotryum mycophilum]|uniref:Uncharacterized protein n=1 Tax=Cladobotryum mycophilum TaxID=491253 RepID=A0ABR0SPN6_9HYPO
MPVTEFATMKLRSGYDALEFLEALMEVQEIQDAWTRQNQPHNLDAGDNLSSMYTEDTNPTTLLITAPWDSPQGHHEWIQTGDNQRANARLSQFIVPGCSSVLLFHMESAGKRPQMRTAFVHKDSNDGFDICRITVKADQRKLLQSKYQDLEDELRECGLEQSIWAGWRIETSGDDEDLVVFWSNDVPAERLEDLLSMSDKKDHRRFKHVV